MAEKKLETDMAFFQTVQDFVAWKKEGMLPHFKPELRPDHPNFRDATAPIWRFPKRPDLCLEHRGGEARDAPNRRWISSSRCSPASSSASIRPTTMPRSICSTYRQKYGWNWMDRYIATSRTRSGSLPVARSVAAGENTSRSTLPRGCGHSSAMEVAFSAVDETPVFTLTGASSRTRHPERGEALSHLVPGQGAAGQVVGSFSSRSDAPLPQGLLSRSTS